MHRTPVLDLFTLTLAASAMETSGKAGGAQTAFFGAEEVGRIGGAPRSFSSVKCTLLMFFLHYCIWASLALPGSSVAGSR